jgi:hypothetical protein
MAECAGQTWRREPAGLRARTRRRYAELTGGGSTGAAVRGTLSCVTIVAFLRRFVRRLQPPGNRGPLDTEYRQPNSPTAVDSAGPHPHSGLDLPGFGQ